MATTTTMQGFRIPEQTDTPDVPRDITNLAHDVELKVMGVYSSASDRDTKIASPVEGQFAYCVDVGTAYVFHSGSWVTYPPPQVSITSGATVPANSSGNDGDVFFKV